MAKLSAHGIELDRREYPSGRVAVMSDGKILRNQGFGWKLWKRVKPGVDPKVYAEDARKRYEARPAVFHEYMRELINAADLEHRYRLHTAVSLLPNDPDGVWSEVNDTYSGYSIDLDDCLKLCRLYEAAMAARSEEHTSELQSPKDLVCRLLL